MAQTGFELPVLLPGMLGIYHHTCSSNCFVLACPHLLFIPYLESPMGAQMMFGSFIVLSSQLYIRLCIRPPSSPCKVSPPKITTQTPLRPKGKSLLPASSCTRNSPKSRSSGLYSSFCFTHRKPHPGCQLQFSREWNFRSQSAGSVRLELCPHGGRCWGLCAGS